MLNISQNNLLETNLSFIIHLLYNILIQNFASNQSGFLHSISILIDYFPPVKYPNAWCLNNESHSKMRLNLMGLLIEMSESNCYSINEFTLILKTISNLYAGKFFFKAYF